MISFVHGVAVRRNNGAAVNAVGALVTRVSDAAVGSPASSEVRVVRAHLSFARSFVFFGSRATVACVSVSYTHLTLPTKA